MAVKCLIFFSIGIGDSLMVTPVLKQLKNNIGFEFDALVMSPPVRDIMKNSGYFKKVHFIDFLKEGYLKSFRKLISIRKLKYDRSILAFPSNHFKYHLVHHLIAAKKRTANKYVDRNFPDLSFLSGDLIKEDRSLHATEQNFRLFEKALNTEFDRDYQMKISIDDDRKEFANKFLDDNDLKGKIRIGIHAGSDIFKNMEKKRWGSEKYEELISTFKYNTNVRFLIFGGKDELSLNKKINSSNKSNSILVKGTSFLESCSLIEKCSIFVSGDTGLMHTASSLKIPVVSIFGPTNSVYTKPMNPGSIVIKKKYPCIPCYEYSRKPLVCTQKEKYKCIENITVYEVKKAIIKILKNMGL